MKGLSASLEDPLDPWLPKECPAETLIRLCRCAGRSEKALLGILAVLKEMLCPGSYLRHTY